MEKQFLEKALTLAQKAYKKGEVPVGAVVVKNGKIIGMGYNKRETKKSPLAHAEVLAIKGASCRTRSWRLDGAEMYVTLEPCMMCSGAIFLSRIKKVYYFAKDTSVSQFKFCKLQNENYASHKVEMEYVEDARCKELLQKFFKETRKQSK